MPVKEWPKGTDYFAQTNVGAIIRNLEPGNITLGLHMPGQHRLSPEPSQGANDVSTMVNHPALAMKDDVSRD